MSLIKKPHYFLCVGIALLLLNGCSDSDQISVENRAEIDDQIISDYLLANAITATKDESGIYYEVTTENPTGAIQQISGSILTVYYHAKVLDGSDIEIISLTGGNDPAKMKQGVGAIFPEGLDIGLAFMKQGETFKFYIPSHLAYGDFSFASVIPANSIIEIEVELIDIQNESDRLMEEVVLMDNYVTANALNDTINNPLDSVDILATGEYYKRIAAGNFNSTPPIGDLIGVTYTGTFLDGSQFDATGNAVFEYAFNTGTVIAGLDNGISQMDLGERALIIIPSSNAYKESVMYIPSYLGAEFVTEQIIPTYASIIPPFRVLVFDVTLQ